jgi:hypothetical protein
MELTYNRPLEALPFPVIKPVPLYALLYIIAFHNSKGYAPTWRDLMRECGWRSPGTAAAATSALLKIGVVVKRDRSARSLRPTVRFIPANQLGAK